MNGVKKFKERKLTYEKIRAIQMLTVMNGRMKEMREKYFSF